MARLAPINCDGCGRFIHEDQPAWVVVDDEGVEVEINGRNLIVCDRCCKSGKRPPAGEQREGGDGE